ncbi:MAG: hypothetical protein ACRYF0_06970 [Janthinobacterium lividum]
MHLVAALLALLAGTYILAVPKGTRWHRWVGRAYAGSMAVLLLTAFQIYFLFGRFGIVHLGALGSLFALAVGIGAAVLRPVGRNWLRWHYLGMGASVTGLYAAFIIESTYRFFPLAYFWWLTLGLAALVFGMGGVLLRRHYPPRLAQAGRARAAGLAGSAG